VDIILAVCGDVVVEDNVDVGDVQTSARGNSLVKLVGTFGFQEEKLRKASVVVTKLLKIPHSQTIFSTIFSVHKGLTSFEAQIPLSTSPPNSPRSDVS
jgi:hypothetical protein